MTTKDDLPPLPAHPYWHIGEDWSHKEILALQAYALAAIATHDTKREKVALIRTPNMVWHQAPPRWFQNSPDVERAWAYIEREGASAARQPAQEPFAPNTGCKTPGDCRKEGFCMDGWHCASLAGQPALEPIASWPFPDRSRV